MKEQRDSPKLRPDLDSTCLKAHVTTHNTVFDHIDGSECSYFWSQFLVVFPFQEETTTILPAVSAAAVVLFFPAIYLPKLRAIRKQIFAILLLPATLHPLSDNKHILLTCY